MHRIFLLIPLLLTAETSSAKTLYVSKSGDGSDGLSWETGFNTVGEGIGAATSGDEIWVEGSTRYLGPLELRAGISLLGGFSGNEKPDEFSSRDWAKNPTILDDNRAVLTTFEGSVVDGFVITGGFDSEFTGIRCEGDTVMRNCRVTGNIAFRRGAAITVMPEVSVVLMNCLVDNNDVDRSYIGLPPGGIGSALLGFYTSKITLIHCTFADNSRDGGVDFNIDGELTVVNSIIRDAVVGLSSEWSISHSNINHGTDGVGNINEDPLFLNPEEENYRLQVSSPCVDTGTKTTLHIDFEKSSRPVDVLGTGHDGPGAYDMGCYEFQLKNSDLTRDGKVDAEDLLMFQEEWMREGNH